MFGRSKPTHSKEPAKAKEAAKKVAAKAKEVSGEKPQKGEGKPDKPQKLAAGDEVEVEFDMIFLEE